MYLTSYFGEEITVKRSTICKLSIACAVLCGIIGGISVAPIVVSIILAIVAFICLLLCVIVYIFGGIIWLFTIGKVNVFGFASSLSGFGIGLFNFIGPVANFSFNYITPIAGGIALCVGVLGIILSAVGISKANKRQQQNNELPAPSTASEDGQTADTAKKKHKKKTEKGVCVASLVVCIVFSVIAAIAIAVAVIAVNAAWV